jgi:DNA polymerase III sliding clamp (beta) subunit (PCNA family)
MLLLSAVSMLNNPRTERERVGALRSVTVGDDVTASPLATVTANVAAAFDMTGLPQTVIIPEPADRTASALVPRKPFLDDLKSAKRIKSGIVANRRYCVLTFGSAVTLTTFDGETLLRSNVTAFDVRPDCELSRNPVAVTIPDDSVAALLRKIKTDDVRLMATIDANGDATLRVETGSAGFTLPADDADRWETQTMGIDSTGKPCNPVRCQPVRDLESNSTKPFSATGGTIVTAGNLRTALRRTMFASSTESTRYALGGCLCEQTTDAVTFAATDSRRLAVYTVPAETVGELEPSETAAVIPFSALSIVSDILGRLPDAEPVCVALTTTEYVIESDGRFAVRGRLVAGRFPRYREVIPATEFTFRVQRTAFIEQLETAGIVSDDENRGMLFRFNGTDVTASASSPALGKSSVIIPADTVRGDVSEPVSITFDPDYLVDMLKQSASDSVDVRLVDSETAAVFVDSDSDSGTYVVMPLSADR